ncbi:DUF2141 domain-containing protein [Maricaulaceae bacterium EIL42A08]|nr:DUF2141 domain-containing protein [Maricaulaceae bacterium EIL42A08]
MNTPLKALSAICLAGAALVAFTPPQVANAAAALCDAAVGSESQELTVRVVYPSNQAGEIWVGLYADEEAFDAGEEYRSARIPADQPILATVFADLPAGEYSLIAFHDSNSYNDFNSNFLGIPIERYGFSNNPRPRFRGATWAESRFELSAGTAHDVTIELMGAGG